MPGLFVDAEGSAPRSQGRSGERLVVPIVSAASLGVLLLIAYATVVAMSRPFGGFFWLRGSGIVTGVFSGTSADAAGLRRGDVLVSIDGVPTRDSVRRSVAAYSAPAIGESLDLSVLRDGAVRPMTVRLAPPSPLERLHSLEILLIAFCFAGFGFYVWAHNPHDRAVVLFLAATHSVAALISVGWLSLLCRPGAFAFYNLFLALSAAVGVHFHLVFLQPRPSAERGRMLAGLYALAAIVPLLYLPGWLQEVDIRWYRLSVHGARYFGVLGALAIAALLLRAYAESTSAHHRRRIRLVVFGTVAGLAPATLLSILPEAIDPDRSLFVPYEITAPFLLLVPLSYGIAIHRHDLLGVDRLVNRGVVHATLVLILAFTYLALAGGLIHVWPGTWTEKPLAWGAIALVIAWLFEPLRERLQRVADRLFYGGWYDPRALVSEMSQALAGIVDADKLAALLVGRLSATLHLRGAALLLGSREENQLEVEVAQWPSGPADLAPLPRSGLLCRELVRAARPRGRLDLASALEPAALLDEERAWLAHPDVQLWVPLVGRGTLHGALLLGAKAGEEPFDSEDRRLLSTIAWSAAVAAENVQLFSALLRRADEVNRLYSQLVQSREAERKRLAQELHDRVIQDLINLPYALGAELPAAAAIEEGLRTRLRAVIDGLRQICTELRPPALDDLSLGLAVRGHVEEVRERYGLDVSLKLARADELETLPEEARLCLFRVLQEALTNVHRHAGAKKVEVELLAGDGQVTLEVRDDGRGLVLPANLRALIRDGHFGLAGAQERLAAFGGSLQISPEPGHGTRLRVTMPWAPGPSPPSRVSDNA
jgi:signal transduction histidine kinase